MFPPVIGGFTGFILPAKIFTAVTAFKIATIRFSLTYSGIRLNWVKSYVTILKTSEENHAQIGTLELASFNHLGLRHRQ
jgi:hypothetical protein